MTKSNRLRIKARFLQRQEERDVKMVYYTDKEVNGKRSWSGGRDLASSAYFTPLFCRALVMCWQFRYSDTMPENLALFDTDFS